MEEPRARRLINEYLDGSIAAGDFAELQDALRASDELRRDLYDLMAVDRLLGERYELPDYISVQAQTMNDTWVARRGRTRKFFSSIGAAAAVLMLSAIVFFFVRGGPDPIVVEASVDGRFHVEGRAGGPAGPKPGEVLRIERGVVSAKLSPYIEACFEGPARVKVRDAKGNVELLEGRGYFEISPGGKGFEVHCNGSVVRDIGTKFGVALEPGGFIEVHVETGEVEITDAKGGVHPVESGRAVRYGTVGPMRPARLDMDDFVQALPWHRVLFHDDFEAVDGTPLSGRKPPTGGKWLVFSEGSKTMIRDGRLDTSYGYRTLSASCQSVEGQPGSHAYLLTFSTAVPENMGDKPGSADALERVTLLTREGTRLCSLVGRSADGHHWRLVDERSGVQSEPTGASALASHELTLLYESWSGRVVLYEGDSPQGRMLASLEGERGHRVGAVSIANEGQGDVAIDDLAVKVAVYAGKSAGRD